MRNRREYIKNKIDKIKENFKPVSLDIEETNDIRPFKRRKIENSEERDIINDIEKLRNISTAIDTLLNNDKYFDYHIKLSIMKNNLDLFKPLFDEYDKYIMNKNKIFFSDLIKWRQGLLSLIHQIFQQTLFVKEITDIEEDYIVQLNTVEAKANEAIKSIN